MIGSHLILDHADVFQQLPDYVHEALIASICSMRRTSACSRKTSTLLAPWRGAAGQVAFYRQYSQIRQAEGELRFDGQREDRLYGVLGATEAPVHAAPRCLRSSSS